MVWKIFKIPLGGVPPSPLVTLLWVHCKQKNEYHPFQEVFLVNKCHQRDIWVERLYLPNTFPYKYITNPWLYLVPQILIYQCNTIFVQGNFVEYLGNRLIYDTSGPVGPQPTGNPYLSMYIFSQKRGGIRTGPEAKIGSWFCLSYLSLLTSGVGPMGLSIQFYQASSDDTGYPPTPCYYPYLFMAWVKTGLLYPSLRGTSQTKCWYGQENLIPYFLSLEIYTACPINTSYPVLE